MKIFLLSFLILSRAFAQDYSSILANKGASLGNTPQAQIAKTREILALVKAVTDAQGTVTEAATLQDTQGNSYPVMVIKAVNGNLLNQEALRVFRVMSGLPIVFSPYDLGRSRSNAFFDPTGKMLGVSYEFILGDKDNSSYQHELYHAWNFQKILGGAGSLWTGVMKVNKGENLSSVNRDYYQRFASLDELPATALSLWLDTVRILELKRTQTPQEFNESRGKADELLGEIYQSVKAGSALAKQSREVMERALKTEAHVNQAPLKLGNTTRNVGTTIFNISSFAWEIKSGRGTLVEVPKGTEVKLFWTRTPGANELHTRMREIIRRSILAEAAFKQAENCIYVMIEYPKLEQTNYGCLEQSAPRAFAVLDNL